MKRYLSILSLITVLALTAHGQTPSTSQRPAEKLDKQQLKALIATAKTPEEHLRIARFYDQQALDYLDQAKEHEGMLAAYNANLSQTAGKSRVTVMSQIAHCEYVVKTFREMAAKSSDLAREHEQMAKDAGHPVPSSRYGK